MSCKSLPNNHGSNLTHVLGETYEPFNRIHTRRFEANVFRRLRCLSRTEEKGTGFEIYIRQHIHLIVRNDAESL